MFGKVFEKCLGLCFEKVKIEKCFRWGPDLKNVVYGSTEENSFGRMNSLSKKRKGFFLCLALVLSFQRGCFIPNHDIDAAWV